MKWIKKKRDLLCVNCWIGVVRSDTKRQAADAAIVWVRCARVCVCECSCDGSAFLFRHFFFVRLSSQSCTRRSPFLISFGQTHFTSSKWMKRTTHLWIVNGFSNRIYRLWVHLFNKNSLRKRNRMREKPNVDAKEKESACVSVYWAATAYCV